MTSPRCASADSGTTPFEANSEEESLWIFGYGSLVWRPAFEHLESHPAYIKGFARRFWQGSMDHRGLPERPGRVVTLLPNESVQEIERADFEPGPCWGTAYRILRSDPDRVLAGLDHRERGGYDRLELDLYFPEAADADASVSNQEEARPTPGLVYIASPANRNYLGFAPVDAIAHQIAGARGPSGANPEYVFELAQGLREMGAVDPHVFSIEAALAEHSSLTAESPEQKQKQRPGA